MITLISPRGSSVYLVAFLIDLFPFPPVSCTYEPDSIRPVGETSRYYPVAYSANAVIPFLVLAMAYVLGNYTVRVAKGILSQIERDAMF